MSQVYQQAGRPVPPRPPMVMDQTTLLARIRAQVEFYFSPINLARDTFLRSLLEGNGNRVLVETIASFPKVRELYAIGYLGISPAMAPPAADPAIVCHALEGSHVVTVSRDGNWISPTPYSSTESQEGMEISMPVRSGDAAANEPSFKPSPSTAPSSPSSQTTTASSSGVPTHPSPTRRERTTVVVSDVPAECVVEEILQAFCGDSFKPKSAHRDGVEKTWLINFATEADAGAALLAVSDKKIRGEPIRALLKSERSAVSSLRVSATPAECTVRPPPTQWAPPHQFPPPRPYNPVPPQQLHQQHQYAFHHPVGAMPPSYPAYAPYGTPIIVQQQQRYPPAYGHAMPQQHMPYGAAHQQQQIPPPPPHNVAACHPQNLSAPYVGQGQRSNDAGYSQNHTYYKGYQNQRKKRGSKKGKGGGDMQTMDYNNASKQQQQQSTARNRDNNSPLVGSDGSTTSNNRDSSGRQPKKFERRRSIEPKGSVSPILSDDDFPALTNKVEANGGKRPDGPKQGAYAAAVLKSRDATQASPPRLPSTGATGRPDSQTKGLEQSMSQMHVKKPTPALPGTQSTANART